MAKRTRSPRPKPDGQVRDIIEVLLGTAMRPGEVLALRSCDIEDLPAGMIASVNGTVVQRKGSGAERQPRPKTDASIRRIPVPEFAAVVLRRRIANLPAAGDVVLLHEGPPPLKVIPIGPTLTCVPPSKGVAVDGGDRSARQAEVIALLGESLRRRWRCRRGRPPPARG